MVKKESSALPQACRPTLVHSICWCAHSSTHMNTCTPCVCFWNFSHHMCKNDFFLKDE